MRATVKIIILTCVLTIGANAFADERDQILIQKQELETIQTEVEEGRKMLDSLKQTELSVQKRLLDNEQQIAGNRKVIRRLSREADEIRQSIAAAETELGQRQLELDLSRRRYLGNIRQFYLAAHHPSTPFSSDLNEECNLHRQIVYLTAVAGFESGQIQQAAGFLVQTGERMGQLSGEKKKVTKLRQKRESANVLAQNRKQKQQKDLERIRRTKTEESDRILTLEMAAREMEQIIDRLQREAQERELSQRTEPGGPSIFASLKGQLLSPYKGKVTTPFGPAVDPITNLTSLSSGITIKGAPGRRVVAVASGTVAYVGNLRGYGIFVIIRHDEEYFTTYAGLGETIVTTDEYVLAGNKLAVSGASGVVKFELRQGSRALDPIEWIRIDSF